MIKKSIDSIYQTSLAAVVMLERFEGVWIDPMTRIDCFIIIFYIIIIIFYFIIQFCRDTASYLKYFFFA